ncbi:MAG TPA: hypothetical protein VGK20_16490 [Candidatus Binatia bacterium]
MQSHLLRFVAAAACCAFSVRPAAAAFPGSNGLITFTRDTIGDTTGQVAVAAATHDAEVTLLTSGPATNGLSAWSADGGCLTFYSDRDGGDAELYVMGATGSAQTRLTLYPGFDYDGVFSPDGTRLAFTSDRDGDSEIYEYALADGSMAQLTHNTDIEISPAWSPDGSKIAFVSRRDGNFEIYTMNSDGTDQTRLTDNTGDDLYPNWSPDGKHIAFATVRPGTIDRDIWTMDDDGGNPKSLLARAGNDSEPAWSPDGTLIAFSGNAGTAAGHIYVVSASDGSGLVQVTTSETVDDRQPDWQSVDSQAPVALCPTVTPVLCGDATYDSAIKAGDAQAILRAAVGQGVVCPLIRCDVDDNKVIVASDALRTLQFAVGIAVTLDCPPPT